MAAVIAPFSLPVMQLGFEGYLLLMHEDPARFERLMRVNEEFAVAWGNALLRAGADAISLADPVASPTIVPHERFLQSGFPVARHTIARFAGPCAYGLASGRALPIVDDIVRLGAIGVSASVHEDLAAFKEACRGRLVVMGNLNAIEMCRWTAADADRHVREAIAAAGAGGGFVLTDNHGEIPWQVPEDVLLAVHDAVERWGRYPLAGAHADA
jgi:uroporphyrinogen decarboxylase